jgi:hypothetical protein
MADDRLLNNGIKLLGETFVTPGSSLILEGRVGAGLLHGALGIAAMSFMGPLGPLARILIAANSYSRSIADQNIWELRQTPSEEPTPGPSRPTPAPKPT